jgi:hypothetical protein
MGLAHLFSDSCHSCNLRRFFPLRQENRLRILEMCQCPQTVVSTSSNIALIAETNALKAMNIVSALEKIVSKLENIFSMSKNIVCVSSPIGEIDRRRMRIFINGLVAVVANWLRVVANWLRVAANWLHIAVNCLRVGDNGMGNEDHRFPA